ncbi:hypothetical protein QBC36DRAFT_291269 [Triangularia setosa]|uniref:Proteophosphoglycan ppg4 n=1 Tax=Triangularia setosa TaxID=2587417 RepID=A0AAN6W5U4_9PEZI|nr:hypothetical protein QBC36DRAFT_291269 [Podospora setosa]
MGNAQSTETARRYSQKLSKPKTNNHATAGLLSPSGSSNNPKRYSNRPLPDPPLSSPSPVSTPTSSVFEQPDTLQTRNGRSASFTSVPALQQESKRRSLFRVRSTQVVSDIDRRDSVGSGSRMVDRLNRTSSLTYESAIAYYGPPEPEEWSSEPRMRTSWNYNLTSYEAKRLLNLVEEPGLEHATTMSENRMTVVTETTWKSSNPTNPPSTSITRASSDVSLYMPVRRRSIIQTPGVATRANSMRNIPAPPRLNPRYSHPPTPSLSRQQSFESYRDGIVSMPPRLDDLGSIPRAVTPREEDYQSIGGYKLGSLRITNGPASPSSPEVERKGGSRFKLGGDDDYFANAEAPDQSNTTSSAARPPAQQPRAAGPCNTATTVTSQVTSVVSGGYSVTSTQQYLEVNFSPLSIRLSPPTSPSLQTTSKHTALEDSLFEDDVLSEFAAGEILDVRLDPNAKPPHFTGEVTPTKPLSRSDSGFISTTSPSSESPHKPLAKADSGYSSNVSLRSFRTKDQSSKMEGMGSLEGQLIEANRRSTSIRSNDREQTGPAYVIAPPREAPPPPVPPKDARHQSPGPSPNPKSARKSSRSASNLARENSLSRANTSKVPLSLTPIKNLRSRDRGPTSPESVPTPVSAKSSKSDKSTSALSIGSKPQKPNRLQRLLSSARRSAVGPLEAHATHAVEKNAIPSIPREVESKLQEHNGRFPMTTKRLALRPRASLDTLKTIFSVGSMEASLDALNSVQKAPAAAEPGAERIAKESSWRQTMHSVPTHIAHVAAHVMPKKPIVRKPVAARQSFENRRSLDGRPRLVAEFALRDVTTSSPRNSHEATLDALVGGRAVIYSPPDEDQEDARFAITHTEVLSSLPSPLLPSPLARAMSLSSKTNTPPPVSMATRRQMSLRVPPPLRSQSSNSSLHRTASRESIQSYPAAQPLSRKPSRESIHSYPSYQQGMIPDAALPTAAPTMDPRRLSAFRQSSVRPPAWEVQPEQGLSLQPSYTSINGGSRRGSLSSVQEHEEDAIKRPSSAQPWQMQSNQQQQQPLRHRASYDEWNQQFGRRPQSGHPPSMSNGYTAPSKPVYGPRHAQQQHTPANTWSRSQLDASAGQWYQDGPCPQVPRGHYRKRSMSLQSSYGPRPPYRVLHSYNSPAYRNAPIWG